MVIAAFASIMKGSLSSLSSSTKSPFKRCSHLSAGMCVIDKNLAKQSAELRKSSVTEYSILLCILYNPARSRLN
jgi:hypothetical protein